MNLKAEFAMTICKRIWKRRELRFTSNICWRQEWRLNLLSQFIGEFVGKVNWGLLWIMFEVKNEGWDLLRQLCRRICRRNVLRFTSNYLRSQEWKFNLLRQFEGEFVGEYVGEVNWSLLRIIFEVKNQGWIC